MFLNYPRTKYIFPVQPVKGNTFGSALPLVGGVGLQVNEGLVSLLLGGLRVEGQGLVQRQHLIRDEDAASEGGERASGRGETRSVSRDDGESVTFFNHNLLPRRRGIQEGYERDTRGRGKQEGERETIEDLPQYHCACHFSNLL